jgi:hypothetical protein
MVYFIVQHGVFTYQEQKRAESKGAKTDRDEPQVKKNYMVVHRKNVNSNDGRIKHKEKLYNDYKVDKRALYSQAKKQNKRSKSSGSHGPVKKSRGKPILFSTIDNRPAGAMMTQKYSWKDIHGVPPNLINSPKESPKKEAKRQVYEYIGDGTSRHKLKSSKQPVTIKHKNESQSKVLRPYPYPYQNEVIEYPKKEVKKVYAKTERQKFKLDSHKIVRKENIQLLEANTLNSAREYQSNLTDRSNTGTLKWTLKSREGDKTAGKHRNIEDFEKLFYQSMSNEKGKVVSQKGVDFSHLKSFKLQNPTSYRSLSKTKSSKNLKSKKGLKMYESKTKKSKRGSPYASKYKHNRCPSRGVKNKPPTDESSKCSGYVKTLGTKKSSINQSQSRSKITPQTTRYSMSGMEKYFKFKQSQVADITNQEKQIKKVKSLKSLKS